ncbi:MAG TPA: hypothetical protein VJJ46_05305 [Anaerolineales bacterium]|nr:hypothetical protein [Anaerolineales bacterium]
MSELDELDDITADRDAISLGRALVWARHQAKLWDTQARDLQRVLLDRHGREFPLSLREGRQDYTLRPVHPVQQVYDLANVRGRAGELLAAASLRVEFWAPLGELILGIRTLDPKLGEPWSAYRTSEPKAPYITIREIPQEFPI